MRERWPSREWRSSSDPNSFWDFHRVFWWNAVTLAAFGVFRGCETRRWSRLLPCAGAVVVGTLLGGIQLLPSADAVAHSVRVAVSSDFALTLLAAPDEPVPAVVPVLLRARRLQRARVDAVPRVRHLLGRDPPDCAHLGLDQTSRSARTAAAHCCRHGFRRSHADPCAWPLRRTSPSCSRISRCSRPFALRSAISSWCNSRSRSWRRSRSTICWTSLTDVVRCLNARFAAPVDPGGARRCYDPGAECAAAPVTDGTRSRARPPRPQASASSRPSRCWSTWRRGG